MSFRREKDDGDISGSGSGSKNRRNSLLDKGKARKYAASEGPGSYSESLHVEENIFSEESDKDRYLITYADLITLLLGLFIILYAISNVDIEKYQEMTEAMGDIFGGSGKIPGFNGGTGGSPFENPMTKLKNDLNDVIEEYNFGQSIKLEENERGITIRILDDILFSSGNSNLTLESRIVLTGLANILRELPYDIRVEGHTDNVPINSSLYPSNWHLSVNRALNTAYYLINEEKLPPDKVSIVGYSEYKPIASNNTNEGRASNRRVDIIIIKK